MKNKVLWFLLLVLIILVQLVYAARLAETADKLNSPCDRLVYTDKKTIFGQIDQISESYQIQKSLVRFDLLGSIIENVNSTGGDTLLSGLYITDGSYFGENSILINETLSRKIGAVTKLERNRIAGSRCVITCGDKERIMTVSGICDDGLNTYEIYITGSVSQSLTGRTDTETYVRIDKLKNIPLVTEKLKEYKVEMEIAAEDGAIAYLQTINTMAVVAMFALELAFVLSVKYCSLKIMPEKRKDVRKILIYAAVTIVPLLLFFMIPSFNAFIKTKNINVSWMAFLYLAILYLVKECEIAIISNHKKRQNTE